MIQTVSYLAVDGGSDWVAPCIGALGGQGLSEACELVAGVADCQGLAGGLLEVNRIKVAVLVGVAGGFVDGCQAVAVGVVAVAGGGAVTGAVEAGEAVAAVVACAPGDGGGRVVDAVQAGPQVLGEAGEAAGAVIAVRRKFVGGHATVRVEAAVGGAAGDGCSTRGCPSHAVPAPGFGLVQCGVGQACHKGDLGLGFAGGATGLLDVNLVGLACGAFAVEDLQAAGVVDLGHLAAGVVLVLVLDAVGAGGYRA